MGKGKNRKERRKQKQLDYGVKQQGLAGELVLTPEMVCFLEHLVKTFQYDGQYRGVSMYRHLDKGYARLDVDMYNHLKAKLERVAEFLRKEAEDGRIPKVERHLMEV